MVRQQLAAACLLAASGVSAGGIRASGSGAVSRHLAAASTDLGCFADSKNSRRLTQGLMGESSLTPDLCNDYCAGAGNYAYYALQYGQECWCGVAGADYAALGALDASECSFPCSGDSTSLCGGYSTFQIFEYAESTTQPQPAGHLGCYVDQKSDRVFTFGATDTALTAATCKATCTGFAYYGLQYGKECWCGSDADYARHGTSTACDYRCSGDSTYICGGYSTMSIFSSDGTDSVTPAPVTVTTAPVAPVAPTVTIAPVAPAAPTATIAPVAPVAPTATIAPVAPVAPTATIAPVAPAAPTATTAPVAPTAPTVTIAPVAPAAPTATIAPVAPTAPTVTIAPAAPTVTTAPVAPAVPTLAPSVNGTDVPTGITLPPGTLPPIPFVDPGTVLVDLVPCILTPSEPTESTAGPFVMTQFFQGYWTPTTEVIIAGETTDLLAAMIYTDDASHGRCSSVYVGIVPSTEQITALTTYSAQFKVRVVYFWDAVTPNIATFQLKLGISTYYADGLLSPTYVQLNTAGSTKVKVTQSDLQTDLTASNLAGIPVRLTTPVAEVESLAEYADETGTSIVTGDGVINTAVLTYTGADGSEEMHIFFPLAWFDAGSWAWAHYLNEWATKGVFMGERRFYLGAVVDDLFLATPEFVYGNVENEAEVASRCSGVDLERLKSSQDSLNAQYTGSEIITEFAANNAGILEKILYEDMPPYEETPVTVKGTKWFETGQTTVHPVNWLTDNLATMQAQFSNGDWSSDDTLAKVLDYINTPNTFFHQSHTLIHLSRDQLRYSDCYTEDTANVQIALLTGMWESDNYNWRSMVSPGITGLFNENCLATGDLNLMTCYPGDNTFDGTTAGAAELVNPETPFHSIYTTVADNGYAGMQIVPRFATYIYFNCISAECLVNENEYIRRKVCLCANLDPSLERGECTSDAAQCNEDDGGIASFGSIDALLSEEASTTTRYLLAGRRDKYMFHQANVIPAPDYGDGSKSFLEVWYELVMQAYSQWISFPVKSVKFDDLCTNFKQHEDLDASGAYVTMSVEEDGSVSGMTYNTGSGAGLVPLTVPTELVASYPVTGLPINGEAETYGTDTTYYLYDTGADLPTAATQPAVSELPTIVEQTATVVTTIAAEDEAAIEAETEEAEIVNLEVAGEEGYVVEGAPVEDLDAGVNATATTAPAATPVSVAPVTGTSSPAAASTLSPVAAEATVVPATADATTAPVAIEGTTVPAARI